MISSDNSVELCPTTNVYAIRKVPLQIEDYVCRKPLYIPYTL